MTRPSFGCFSKDFKSIPILPILPAHPANIEKALSDIHTQSSARMGPEKHLQLLIIILLEVSGSYGKSQKRCLDEDCSFDRKDYACVSAQTRNDVPQAISRKSCSEDQCEGLCGSDVVLRSVRVHFSISRFGSFFSPLC